MLHDKMHYHGKSNTHELLDDTHKKSRRSGNVRPLDISKHLVTYKRFGESGSESRSINELILDLIHVGRDVLQLAALLFEG